tara:strand:+ start:163 stop:696 length:534 start_codon:yes stop_codon:yes gene_type:complete
MKLKKTKIMNMYLIEPELFKDKRGIFRRNYCQKKINKKNIFFKIKQCNVSENFKKGTLRGFHYQKKSKKDSKIITCIRGSILNVTIDLRKKSKTFLSHQKIELSSKNRRSALVPGKCANAFITLEDNTIIQYYMSEFFNKKNDGGIRYDDKFFNIKWPIKPKIISNKDKSYKDFKKE